MKKLLIAAAALSVLGGSAAMAQPRWDHDRYDHDRYDHGRYDHDRYDHGRYEHRYDAGRYYGHDRGYYGDRGYQGRWVRGGYLPREYWGPRYVVTDWRARHLRPPPRGYHWVRAGNDYVLAAVATGLIADLLANQY